MVIPDEATARRIGQAEVDADRADTFTVFWFEQPHTRLTLFGVELRSPHRRTREIRHHNPRERAR